MLNYLMAILSLVLIVGSDNRAVLAAVDCNNAVTQADMNRCASLAFGLIDDELNTAYKKITAGLESSELELLKHSQRAWIKFRDAECEFQSSFTRGGSVRPLVHANCLTDITNQRVKDLQFYLTCPEGDLACPRLGP